MAAATAAATTTTTTTAAVAGQKRRAEEEGGGEAPSAPAAPATPATPKTPRTRPLKLATPKHDRGVLVDGKPALWEEWKKIYLVGTEWDSYDQTFNIKWDFNHLEEQLESGELFQANCPVYLFAATEPQLLQLKPEAATTTTTTTSTTSGDAGSSNGTVVPIPVIVAIVGRIAPPSTIGIKSVQRVEEEIVPMRDLKMDWVPYIPRSEQAADPLRLKARYFLLHCTRRRTALKRLKEEEVKRYEYCMPYIFLPHASHQQDDDPGTVVSVVRTLDGRGLTFDYDWEMDDIDEFADELLKQQGLGAEHRAAVQDIIKEEVAAGKEKRKAARAEHKKKLDAISADEKAALRDMQFWKFYPQNSFPDLSAAKSPYINRYYGKAHKVLP